MCASATKHCRAPTHLPKGNENRTEKQKTQANTVNEFDRTDYTNCPMENELNADGKKRSTSTSAIPGRQVRNRSNKFILWKIEWRWNRNSQKVIFIHNVLWMRQVWIRYFSFYFISFSPSYTFFFFFQFPLVCFSLFRLHNSTQCCESQRE